MTWAHLKANRQARMAECDSSKKGKRDWKDHLLSSGLPLEHSVRRVLQQLGVGYASEYAFERISETGQTKTFSVDTLAGCRCSKRPPVWVQLFIECKYRHDGVRWVFAPAEFERFWGPEFSDVFVVLDRLSTAGELDRNKLNAAADKYQLCSKGVEVLPNGSNPASITEAINQLKYAVADFAVADFERYASSSAFGEANIEVCIPILVTTAQIWRINPGTTLEQIREADDLVDIAARHHLLLLHDKPSREMARHTIGMFRQRYTGEALKRLDARFAQTSSRSADGFIQYFAESTPSMFLVLDYERAAETFGSILKFFSKPVLVEPKNDQDSMARNLQSLPDSP